MEGADHVGYVSRFDNLGKLVPHLFTPMIWRMEKFIQGLPPQMRLSMKSTTFVTMEEVMLKSSAFTEVFELNATEASVDPNVDTDTFFVNNH